MTAKKEEAPTMSDKPKIVVGLVIFLVLATFPVWYNQAAGGAGAGPEVELPAGETQCVESKAYMIENHMKLLRAWRNAVVRTGERCYTSREFGEEHEMSLSKTCLRCHTDRETFCNRCHDYADVSPGCWNCHLDPKGN